VISSTPLDPVASATVTAAALAAAAAAAAAQAASAAGRGWHIMWFFPKKEYIILYQTTIYI
jgi:Spy/CpxP family protein refolding chaperone